MTGKLTTHVLDTALGVPAGGMKLALFRIDDDGKNHEIGNYTLNDDGRVDGPLLEGESFQKGSYELHFFVADYFKSADVKLAELPFLGMVPIRFALADDTHYHVPLLVSPYGYSTYRGS